MCPQMRRLKLQLKSTKSAPSKRSQSVLQGQLGLCMHMKAAKFVRMSSTRSPAGHYRLHKHCLQICVRVQATTEQKLALRLVECERRAADTRTTPADRARLQGLSLMLSYCWKFHIMRGAAKAVAQCHVAGVSVEATSAAGSLPATSLHQWHLAPHAYVMPHMQSFGHAVLQS